MRLKDIFSKRSRAVTGSHPTKKYELLNGETMMVGTAKLFRIRAVRDFGKVKAGERGGWVASENNLSHDGNCWVAENGQVFENAKIFGSALISGNARVFGEAEVGGNARVSASAHVSYKAKLTGRERITGDLLLRPRTLWEDFCIRRLGLGHLL
jgi:hypothetical protein